MFLSTPIPFEKRTSLRLPLVSASVEAGFPSPADDYMERGVDLNEALIRNTAATFLVRVKGESMRDAGIRSGDTLIGDKSIEPRDRQIVVAMVGGEFTVKRFRKHDSRIYLEAENSAFAPIEISQDEFSDGLTVWGSVTYIIHKAR